MSLYNCKNDNNLEENKQLLEDFQYHEISRRTVEEVTSTTQEQEKQGHRHPKGTGLLNKNAKINKDRFNREKKISTIKSLHNNI